MYTTYSSIKISFNLSLDPTLYCSRNENNANYEDFKMPDRKCKHLLGNPTLLLHGTCLWLCSEIHIITYDAAYSVRIILSYQW